MLNITFEVDRLDDDRKKIRNNFHYAILYRDQSGAIALFENYEWAEIALKALEGPMMKIGLNRPFIQRILD